MCFFKKLKKFKNRIYSKFIQDVYLENCLCDWKQSLNLDDSIFIAYKSNTDALILYTNRPGIIVGKQGSNIDKLKQALQEDKNIFIKPKRIVVEEIGALVPDRRWSEREIEKLIEREIQRDIE